MGLGFVYAEDIEDMYNELVNLRQTFVNNENLQLDNIIYDIVELYHKLYQYTNGGKPTVRRFQTVDGKYGSSLINYLCQKFNGISI